MQTTVQYIVKRNRKRVPFDISRISVAIQKAFLSENNNDLEEVQRVADKVLFQLNQDPNLVETTVENVQDIVEDALMELGHHKIARNYILYREQHKVAREERVLTQIKEHELRVRVNEHETVIFDAKEIENRLRVLGPDLMRISISEMVDAISRQVYEDIPKHEINLLVLGAARERIEKHYEYSYLAARISIDSLYQSVLGVGMHQDDLTARYREQFAAYIQSGVSYELLNEELASFDMEKISAAIQPERDRLFMFLGVQILSDRYLLRDRSKDRHIFELPQWFWMRVAMGLALKEKEKEKWAIAFYETLSQMDFVSSTPTLFNSGTRHSQMSSCYLNTVGDSLDEIFKLYSDNAKLSKWAGGIGTDWTPIRATGSKIKGTNGESQGVIPFIKIFNDVALAVNQGGKRKGAMCAYMEMWHADIEQFMELKKNTGDERRRAHDINTACWIPDLFMKRVQENGEWTLFCPSDVPDLHDLYGQAFEEAYVAYEAQYRDRAKRLKAVDLWRKLLTMLFETGHPWLTFKDPANVRNPQSHVGVIHSSNLCTEITLNTSKDETAVCNLGSLNLAQMVKDGALDQEKIQRTVEVGIRMLDNVIDNNYYPTPEAAAANLQHRAVGLGVMGYQDALYQLGISFSSEENIEFADRSMEMVSYYAIYASSKLAKERGTYASYEGSKWSQGLFPFDTMSLLGQSRGRAIDVAMSQQMDWATLKDHVKQYGMRNSNTMAIAPTATIANISGVFPCTEPAFKNIYMKENLSGNFIVINRYLMDDLDKLSLWNQDTLNRIKLENGSIRNLTFIPESIREKYLETFEIEPDWVLKAAARRSKWIDQSASTNVFLSTKSGKLISDTYMSAWEKGLKTTYYLRTLGATQVSKTTELETEAGAGSDKGDERQAHPVPAASVCSILDPDCEACQ